MEVIEVEAATITTSHALVKQLCNYNKDLYYELTN